MTCSEDALLETLRVSPSPHLPVSPSPRHALVEFWAEWCIYCRLLKPKTEALARTFGDRVAVGRLDVEQFPEIATRLGIELIPAVAFLCGGKIVQVWYGDLPLREITDFVSGYQP